MNELKRNPALGEATTNCTQHLHTHAHAHINAHTHTHTHTPKHTKAHTHTRKRTRTHTHVHAHTQTNTHTRTHTTYRDGGSECPSVLLYPDRWAARRHKSHSHKSHSQPQGSRGLLATTQTQLAGTLTLAQTPHKAYTTLAGPRGMLEKVGAPDGVLSRIVLAGTRLGKHRWGVSSHPHTRAQDRVQRLAQGPGGPRQKSFSRQRTKGTKVAGQVLSAWNSLE